MRGASAGLAACLLLCASREASAGLRYYGGHVVSNTQVVEVFWTSEVNATVQGKIGAFWTTILASPYLDWLREYDTVGLTGARDGKPGSNQRIGRGTYEGSHVIVPANTSKMLKDSEVAAELRAQIAAGHLPAPTFDEQGIANTIYFVEFPPGYNQIVDHQNTNGSFPAYHMTMAVGGKNVPYAVVNDVADDLEQQTLRHSHELIEAITDAEDGDPEANWYVTDRPLAWVGSRSVGSEIADLCESEPGNDSAKLLGYTVATGWSNVTGKCIAYRACKADGDCPGGTTCDGSGGTTHGMCFDAKGAPPAGPERADAGASGGDAGPGDAQASDAGAGGSGGRGGGGEAGRSGPGVVGAGCSVAPDRPLAHGFGILAASCLGAAVVGRRRRAREGTTALS